MPDGITIYEIRATPDGARTLKIAIVSPSFLPSVGGMEFVAHSLAVEWGKQGHQVLVINWITDKATHPEANYKVARFDTLRGTARVGFHRFPWSWCLGYCSPGTLASTTAPWCTCTSVHRGDSAG